MQPWKLIADPSGYIFRWLVGVLGPAGGGGRGADRRLLRAAADAARFAGALSTAGAVLVSRRVQPGGDRRDGAGDLAVHPGVLGLCVADVGILDPQVLGRPVPLRLVH